MHARTHVRTWSRHAFVRGHTSPLSSVLSHFSLSLSRNAMRVENKIFGVLSETRTRVIRVLEREGKWTETDEERCPIMRNRRNRIARHWIIFIYLLFFSPFLFSPSDDVARDAMEIHDTNRCENSGLSCRWRYRKTKASYCDDICSRTERAREREI